MYCSGVSKGGIKLRDAGSPNPKHHPNGSIAALGILEFIRQGFSCFASYVCGLIECHPLMKAETVFF